jgi:integrase
MGRLNKSGVRGLVRELVTDKQTGEQVERWSIDLRYRDATTGAWQRYRERLADGISAAAAKERARKVNNAATAGTLQAQTRESKKLGEALDAILKWAETNRPASLQSFKTQARALRGVLGELTALDELSSFAVEKFKSARYKALRKAAGVDEGDDEDLTGAATVNRALSLLKRSCTLWVEWGWMRESTAIAVRKVRKLREPEGRVRFLTPAEETALMTNLPKQVIQIVGAATLTGMRRSEITRLKKADVDLAAREITVVKSKSGKVRRIPINDELLVLLRNALAQSAGAYVFTNRKGEPYHPDSITHAFVRTCKRAGLTNLRLHDCRHHFATMLRREGADLDVVRQLLGHSHLSMTERYAHVGRDQLHQAVARIGSSRIAQHSRRDEDGDDRKADSLRLVATGEPGEI